MSLIRRLSIVALSLVSISAAAHRIEYYTSNGCLTVGSPLVLDAYVVSAPNTTYYQWQFKNAAGNWVYLVNGNNTINGNSYAVTNATSGPVANNAPALTFATPTPNLDGVQLRCLMRENYLPSSSSSNSPTIWGGNNSTETKILRLKYNAVTGACDIACDDNLMTNSAGYYGGFEQVDYNQSNGSYADNNWSSSKGSSDYQNGAGYKVLNNPYAWSTAFSAFAPHGGNYQMIVKGNTTPAARVWYKTVTVAPGEQYSFSVWAARVDGTAPKIQLKANGKQLTANTMNGAIGEWTQYSGTYAVPPGLTSVTFAILDQDAGSGANNYVLDDICLVKTAEPISIGDKVWFDVDKDGRQDASEPGVAGVTVKLYYDNNSDGNADSANATYTTTTNTNGIYTFDGVIAGKYFVQFDLATGYDGFTIQDAAGVPVGQNSAVNTSTGKTGTHNFTANYQMKDAGMIKNMSISGKTYMDVNGLTDNTVNGALISSASNTALHANLYRENSFLMTVPVSNGSYTFNNLAGNTSYTVSVSTVAGAATPASSLPSGWVPTGENIGTTAGNDGNANGLLNVSLAVSSVTNANFGMQQRPTGGVATAPSQANPGDTISVNVPAATFVATDVSPGVVTAIVITSIPTNANSITINGTKYTSTTLPAAGISIPVNTNGQPTQVIKVDPINGSVTVAIAFKVKDNANTLSTNNGVANVPVFELPDLTPIITVLPATMYGTTSFSTRVDVFNLAEAVPSSGLVTVYVTKNNLINYTYSPSLTMVGGVAVQNNSWSLDATSNPSYYIFTTNSVITAQNKLSFGISGTLTPGATQGQLNNTTIIYPGSGSETNFNNNTDADAINYFQTN